MIPLLGMILLGLEIGLSIATSPFTLDSIVVRIMSFLPHGIIEIPSIALAGSVAYSAHLLIIEKFQTLSTSEIFDMIRVYSHELPITKIALIVFVCLLSAGFVEAHVTTKVIAYFLHD